MIQILRFYLHRSTADTLMKHRAGQTGTVRSKRSLAVSAGPSTLLLTHTSQTASVLHSFHCFISSRSALTAQARRPIRLGRRRSTIGHSNQQGCVAISAKFYLLLFRAPGDGPKAKGELALSAPVTKFRLSSKLPLLFLKKILSYYFSVL